ncbi:MAG TPA: hypothetical protein VFZ61_22085 [Polyangiales bacterium]
MSPTCLVFTTEPAGANYAALIDFCCSEASSFLCVVRDPHLDPGASILTHLVRLAPFLRGSARVTSWPGTELLAGHATLYRYGVGHGLQGALANVATDLFDWLQPRAPEDPCFQRADGTPLLVTTSHERDAYLLLQEHEFHRLRFAHPGLWACLTRESELPPPAEGEAD